jgi:hypothetical protein
MRTFGRFNNRFVQSNYITPIEKSADLGDCPPSGDLVLKALEDADGPVDSQSLQNFTGLSRHTVYLALLCLRRIKTILKALTLQDTRRRSYALPKSDDYKLP